MMGFRRIYILPHMARTNSYSEGLVKQLKRALCTHDDQHSWVDKLPLVALSLKTSLHTTAKIAATQAAFTFNIRLPGHFFNYSKDIQTNSPRVQDMQDFLEQ